jgi:hypothetical protein
MKGDRTERRETERTGPDRNEGRQNGTKGDRTKRIGPERNGMKGDRTEQVGTERDGWGRLGTEQEGTEWEGTERGEQSEME